MCLERAAFAGRDGAGAIGAFSFTLMPGSSYFLTGGAGTGKTTLIDWLSLAMPPVRGEATLFGRNLRKVEARERPLLRRRVGVIFQDLRLIDALSVHENVALAALAIGREPEDYAGPVDEVLAWVGLTKRADVAAGALNEEGRRRLAVARAVINSPDLVIADEPAGGTGLTILRLLAELNSVGGALLIATRDADLAARSGADVIALDPPPVRGSVLA